MISKLKSKIEWRWERFLGHCPSLEEREKSNVKELAQRLKGVSEKETLTNILEWQDRNITFWFERFQITLIYIILIAVGVLFSLLLFKYSLLTSYFLIFITVFSTVTGITVLMIKSYRKIPIKRMCYVIKGDMPVNLLLEHKFGVCKDYAKLSACLLKTIYPDAKICFVKSTNHVAAGIFVGDQLYMLDQHLPIKTIKKWHDKHKVSGKKAYILKGESLQTEDISKLLSNTKTTNLDIEKLKAELTKRLNISEKATDNKTSDLVITWKKGVLFYEDDEFVNYSLVRWLKAKISNEMLGLTKISKLEIEPKKEDLEFKISFIIK